MSRFTIVVLWLALACGCRSTYMISRVDSGDVGSRLVLKNRYRVIESTVKRTDDKGGFWDPKLAVLAFDGRSGLPELELMYPGVFSSDATAKEIVVSVEVTNLGDRTNGLDCDGLNPSCRVSVRHKNDARILCNETFVVAMKSMDEEERAACHGLQSCRLIHVDNPYYKTIVEGYAAAVAAALDKSENGGERTSTDSAPPKYMKPISSEL